MPKPFSYCALALVLALATPRPALAQGPAALNHIALYVVNLQKSADFYKKVLLLPELPEPFKDGKHVWLRIGPHSQLHIIQGNKVQEHDINTHLVFGVKDLSKFRAHLDKLGVRYGNWKGEPDHAPARRRAAGLPARPRRLLAGGERRQVLIASHKALTTSRYKRGSIGSLSKASTPNTH